MKKLLLILLCLPLLFSCGDGNTYVPDDNFEAYLEANEMGNGTPNDNIVLTANIENIWVLEVNNQNISDLTGLEDFTALINLQCDSNQLKTLNVSNNTALWKLSCRMNNLTSLDVSQNTALEFISCGLNQLTSFDVSKNTALIGLDCSKNNLTSLNLSNNTALKFLYCYSNQLKILDLRNGNNTNINSFNSINNPNLLCVDVDNSSWSTANWKNIDAQGFFSEDCRGDDVKEKDNTIVISSSNFKMKLCNDFYDAISLDLNQRSQEELDEFCDCLYEVAVDLGIEVGSLNETFKNKEIGDLFGKNIAKECGKILFPEAQPVSTSTKQ